jgi:hypothetical protein
MVYVTEIHSPLWGHKFHPFHGCQQLFGIGRFGFFEGSEDGHGGSKSSAGEEIRGFLEPGLMFFYEPIVY